MRHALTFLVACVALALAGSGLAAEQAEPERTPFDITADRFEYDRLRFLYVAEGNVVIVQGERSLRADWVSFNKVTRQGIASGNVVIRDGPDRLYGDFLQFHVDDLRGVVYQGELESDESSFRITGREMRKRGRNTYTIEDGVFTTCDCPEEGPVPWQIRAEHTDIEIGGYATARNNKLDILGVPVFWLPWARWPVRTKRTTGFLLPRVNASARRGGDLGLPFFWAARDELNVLLTPSVLIKRGFKGDLDLDYVLGQESWGEFHGALVPDDWEVDESDPQVVIDDVRWALGWRHDQHLPWRLRAKLDLNVISDNEYPFDFTDMDEFRRDRFLESRAFIGRSFGRGDRFSAVGSVWWADDLQNPDDRDRDRFLLQRVPDLRLEARTDRFELWKGLLRSVDVQYTHFWPRKRATSVYPGAVVVGDDVFLDTGIDAIPNGRERNRRGDVVRLDGSVEFSDGRVVTADELLALAALGTPEGTPVAVDPLLLTPDGSRDDYPPGPEGDGRFDEGEPLADQGHRIVLNPRLGHPFWVWGERVELYPEVGLHQTIYQTRAQSFVNRTLLSARFDARTRLRREVTLPWGQGAAIHYLEPSFSYLYLTRTSQRDNPLFVPSPRVPQERVRQLFLENVVRDPADRIDGFHGFQLAVRNRIFTRRGPERPIRLWGELVLASTFDFLGRDLGNFFAEGRFFLLPNLETHLILGYDYEDTELSEALLGVRWSHEKGHGARVRYRFLEDVPRFFESFEFSDERFEEFEEGFAQVNQLDFAVRYAITRNWAVTYSSSFSFENSLFLDNKFGVEYISKCACWAIRVEADDDRASGIEFNFQYKLLGLGEDKLRPFGS